MAAGCCARAREMSTSFEHDICCNILHLEHVNEPQRHPRALLEAAKMPPRATKKPQEPPKMLPRAPKSFPIRAQNRHRNLLTSMCFHDAGQEAPGRPQDPPRGHQKCRKECQEGPKSAQECPKSAPRVPPEHLESVPRPLSLQASEHLNLEAASAGAAKRKELTCYMVCFSEEKSRFG